MILDNVFIILCVWNISAALYSNDASIDETGSIMTRPLLGYILGCRSNIHNDIRLGSPLYVLVAQSQHSIYRLGVNSNPISASESFSCDCASLEE